MSPASARSRSQPRPRRPVVAVVAVGAALLAAATALPGALRAQSGAGAGAGAAAADSAAADSLAAVRAVERFHAALGSADSAGALALLAPDALVLESGELETLAAYAAHHLSADIAFTRGTTSERRVERVTVAGDAAWVVSTSRTAGTFGGRPVNSAGVELIVLVRGRAGWRIAAIHWSSQRRTPPPAATKP